MGTCEKHDDMLKAISELRTEMLKEIGGVNNKITGIETEVNNGWKVIRKNEKSITELDRSSTQSQEQTKTLFKMVEVMSDTVKSIDDKLDTYINDVRQEMKDTLQLVNDIKRDQAVSDKVTKFNLDLNWKTISALGVVAMAIINAILSKI